MIKLKLSSIGDKVISNNSIYLALISLSLYIIYAIFTTTVWGDELYYHFPMAKTINWLQIVSEDSAYSSAYTPLPYLFGSMIYYLFESIIALRFFNYLVVVGLMFVVFKIAKAKNFNPLLLVILVASNPYLLRSAFSYYMFSYGLLFSFIGIYYYFFTKKGNKNIIANLFFGLAVLSQQWMLVVVFALFLTELFGFFTGELDKKEFIKSCVYKVLFLFPSFILFIVWGGLTHPNYTTHQLKPSFEHLNAVMANFGFVGLFVVVFNYKKFLSVNYIPLIFIIPLIWLTIPAQSHLHGIENTTGVAAQLSMQVQKFLFIPYKLSMLVLIGSGLLLLVLILIKKKGMFNNFLKFVILGLTVSFTASVKLGASHIFIAIPFIILFFAEEIKENKNLQAFLTLQMFFLSFFYIVYYSLFLVKNTSL